MKSIYIIVYFDVVEVSVNVNDKGNVVKFYIDTHVGKVLD